MNLFVYPFHREFTDNIFCGLYLVFDCVDCPFLVSNFCCCDYCVFSNACLTALEMGWY